jgi:asparagine synthetase B (glutamine-hydrolysing)
MTVFTDDTWIAALERSDGHIQRFQILEARDSEDHRANRVLTVHTEASCSIVVSGHVSNRRELDLISTPQGHANDAARILRAYLREGDRCFSKIRGIYALALWDPRSDTFLAARDPLGILPLFYAQAAADRWLFSPTLEALLAQASVSKRLDSTVLAEHLFDQWVNGEETEYEAIRRVLPGHVLTIRRHAVSASRYWNPPAADLRVRHTADIVDRFEHVFARAVARALEQGKAGIFLSGGVDSISVASMAKQLAASAPGRELPIALSLLYADPDFHEAQIQRTVATSLGLPARQIALQDAIGQRTATESLLEANAKWPVPMLNLWLPAFLNLAREGEALGCEVILTGGGGDEWLGVSPYLAADLIRSLRFVDLCRFCHKTLRSYDIGYRGLLRTLGWNFGIRPHVARVRDLAAALVNCDVDRRHSERRIPEWIGPGSTLRGAMRDRYVIAARTDRARRAAAPSLYDYEARRTLDHPIVVGEIENKFHFGQRVGVRMLEPYWDAELVELLFTTSPDDLSLGGFAKGLVHRLVRRALPELPVGRQRKIALSTAYTARVRREAQEGWTKMNGVPALAQMGIVNADEADKKVQRLLADASSAQVWLIPHILSVEAWVRAHG